MSTLDSEDITAIRAQIDAALNAGVKVRYIQDSNGNAHEIAQVGNDDSVYQIDNSEIKAKTDLITTAGVVAIEDSSTTIRLKTGSTKSKTVTVSENLTGKTLKLFVRTKQDVFVAEINVTAANGSFSFTPTTALTAKTVDYLYSVREPSDGNNSLYDGILQIAYAADGE